MYVTKDLVKSYLGYNFPSSLDPFVDLTISQAQEYVERFCGDDRFGKRVFEKPDDDTPSARTFDGNGREALQIGEAREITKLVIDDIEIEVSTGYLPYPTNAADTGRPYEWLELVQPQSRFGGNPRIISASPYVFHLGQRNVEVTAKWGFSEAPPADIQLAVLKLVGGTLKEAFGDEARREVKSVTFDDFRVDYQRMDQVAHALQVTDILAGYKRKIFGAHSGVIRV